MTMQRDDHDFATINPAELGLPTHCTVNYLTRRWDRVVQQITRGYGRGMDVFDLDSDGTTLEYENLLSVRGILYQLMQRTDPEVASAVAQRIADADQIYEQVTRPMSMSLFFPATRDAFGLPPDALVWWERRLPRELHGDMRFM